MSCAEYSASKEQTVKADEEIKFVHPLSKYQRLWGTFKGMFPSMAEGALYWGSHKGNTIQIKMTAGMTLFFTYDDVRHWKLETEGSPRTKHAS